MQLGSKHLIILGDRVLAKPIQGHDRTEVGLYLPQSVKENEPVQTALVVETGPGVAFPNLSQDENEPWSKRSGAPVRYIPMQVDIGDTILFVKKEANEVHYNGEKYCVLSQSAILLIVRDEDTV